MLLVVT